MLWNDWYIVDYAYFKTQCSDSNSYNCTLGKVDVLLYGWLQYQNTKNIPVMVLCKRFRKAKCSLMKLEDASNFQQLSILNVFIYCNVLLIETIQRSTNCWTNCIFWQFILIFLAYVENFYVYDAILWSHPGRRQHVKMHSLLLVSFVYPGESYDHCVFWMTWLV